MRQPSARPYRQRDLNPYMLEIANIREQCSWIHKDIKEATEKAIILGRSAIAKVQSKCTSYLCRQAQL